MDNKISEILQLTSVRFITAFYVFLFHLQLYWHVGKEGSLAGFLAKGSAGMSTFFILSGFVLAYRFSQGITDVKKYAFQRFSRIYPVYAVAALLTLPWLFLSLSTYETHWELRLAFVVLVNIVMLQAWMPQFFKFWNDGGSWSLSVEMFFYALFPLLVNRLKGLKNKHLYGLFLVLYTFSALPGLSWLLFENEGLPLVFYSIPIFRLSEFMIGLVSGLLYARGVRIPKPAFYTVLTTTLLCLYLLKGPDLQFIITAHHYATIPLISLVLYSVASLHAGGLYRFMSNSLFVYCGRISYSFYSFQSLLILIFITKHGEMVSIFPALNNPYILSGTMFLLLMALSSLSYHIIENRFRGYLQDKYAKRMQTPSALNSMDIGLKGSLP